MLVALDLPRAQPLGRRSELVPVSRRIQWQGYTGVGVSPGGNGQLGLPCFTNSRRVIYRQRLAEQLTRRGMAL